MKLAIVLLLVLVNMVTFAQKELKITFQLKDTNKELEINQLKYYVSSLVLLKIDEATYIEPDSYHLVDHNDEQSLTISLRLPNDIVYDALRFNIGVDSSKNMQGVHGGDLDPTNGMYWTWQSGYINFKMEAHLNEVELSYHIGGFMFPNNACRNVELNTKKSDHITILVSPDILLNEVDYQTINHIMSPGETAMKLADILPTIFSIQE